MHFNLAEEEHFSVQHDFYVHIKVEAKSQNIPTVLPLIPTPTSSLSETLLDARDVTLSY